MSEDVSSDSADTGRTLYGVALSHVFFGATLACIDGINSCVGINDYDFMGHILMGVFAGSFFVITGIFGVCAHLVDTTETAVGLYTAFLILSSISAVISLTLVILNVLNFGAPLMAGFIYNTKAGLKSLCAVRSITLLIYFILFILFIIAAVKSERMRGM